MIRFFIAAIKCWNINKFVANNVFFHYKEKDFANCKLSNLIKNERNPKFKMHKNHDAMSFQDLQTFAGKDAYKNEIFV